MPRICTSTRFIEYMERTNQPIDIYNELMYDYMINKRNRKKRIMGCARPHIMLSFLKTRRIGCTRKITCLVHTPGESGEVDAKPPESP